MVSTTRSDSDSQGDLEACRQAIPSPANPGSAMPPCGPAAIEPEQPFPYSCSAWSRSPSSFAFAMSCAALGIKRNEEAWQVLITALSEDQGRETCGRSGQCPGQLRRRAGLALAARCLRP